MRLGSRGWLGVDDWNWLMPHWAYTVTAIYSLTVRPSPLPLPLSSRKHIN
jgi:hypothetical protein